MQGTDMVCVTCDAVVGIGYKVSPVGVAKVGAARDIEAGCRCPLWADTFKN